MAFQFPYREKIDPSWGIISAALGNVLVTCVMHAYTNPPKASSREEKNKQYGCSYHNNRNDSFVRGVCGLPIWYLPQPAHLTHHHLDGTPFPHLLSQLFRHGQVEKCSYGLLHRAAVRTLTQLRGGEGRCNNDRGKVQRSRLLTFMSASMPPKFKISYR